MPLEHLIQTLGLPGFVLGAIAEGDGVAFLGGVLAHRGLFPLVEVVLAIALGAVLVDNFLFWMARRGREARFVKRVLAHKVVGVLRHRLDRHPTLAVLGFRFVYGGKTAGALLIGASAISWGRFIVLDTVAALVWSAVLVGLGYGAGTAITAAFGHLKLHLHLLLAILGFAAVAVAILWWHARGRGAGKEGRE